MNRQPKKRRKYIVDPDFQYRFMGRVGILAALILLLSLSLLTVAYYVYGDIQVQVIQPDPLGASGAGMALRENHNLFGFIWPLIGISVIISLAITFLFALVTTHRMAGPIFRLRQVLADMAEGDLRGDVRLRKKDAFKNLAQEIDNLRKRWCASVKESQEISRRLCEGAPVKQQSDLNRLAEILDSFHTE